MLPRAAPAQTTRVEESLDPTRSLDCMMSPARSTMTKDNEVLRTMTTLFVLSLTSASCASTTSAVARPDWTERTCWFEETAAGRMVFGVGVVLIPGKEALARTGAQQRAQANASQCVEVQVAQVDRGTGTDTKVVVNSSPRVDILEHFVADDGTVYALAGGLLPAPK